VYDKVVDLDLGSVEPLAAAPHSPGNIVKVSDMEGTKIDQVEVGSCTNSSYKDLMTLAKILKGKHVHADVSLGVAPGSRQVLQMIAKEGALSDIIDSGARILESACGFCIGNSQSPKTDAVGLRTSNRNFEGRSGTKSAQVYLVSPEVAAVSAITGTFTDPRSAGFDFPDVQMPDRFFIDDSMFIFPQDADASVPIYRGPNIGDPPSAERMSDTIAGEVMLKVGDKITTDHIMPAGARLKFRSNVPKYSEFVFEPVDTTFPKRSMENKEKGKHNIILAGESYGQGSSREHAALCPMYLGVKAVIAKSVERIHAANLVNFGIVSLAFKDESEYDQVDQGDEIELPDIKQKLMNKEPITLVNKTKGTELELTYSYSDRQKEILYEGGLLAYTVK
jgi:aconitate hydratase